MTVRVIARFCWFMRVWKLTPSGATNVEALVGRRGRERPLRSKEEQEYPAAETITAREGCVDFVAV
jgi:hypothetical protein